MTTRFKVQVNVRFLASKVWDKVIRAENSSRSILPLHTLRPGPILLYLCPPSASRGGGHIVRMNPPLGTVKHRVGSLSSSGQNESGIAVHDDRIYVVGGYSIWTNEPLACIQVSEVAFGLTLLWYVQNYQICNIDKWIWIQLLIYCVEH